MANITLVMTPGKTPKGPAFTGDDIGVFLDGKKVVTSFSSTNQAKFISDAVIRMIKRGKNAEKKDVDFPALAAKATAAVTGLPELIALPGNHALTVKVGADLAGKMVLTIEKPAGAEQEAVLIDKGFADITDTQEMAKAVLTLAKTDNKIKLMKGDAQHPKDIRWSIDGTTGSLVMTSHGEKNEKASLDAIKRALRDIGYK
jgi:hypothetical protein